jgi:hypothetical protein
MAPEGDVKIGSEIRLFLGRHDRERDRSYGPPHCYGTRCGVATGQTSGAALRSLTSSSSARTMAVAAGLGFAFVTAHTLRRRPPSWSRSGSQRNCGESPPRSPITQVWSTSSSRPTHSRAAKGCDSATATPAPRPLCNSERCKPSRSYVGRPSPVARMATSSRPQAGRRGGPAGLPTLGRRQRHPRAVCRRGGPAPPRLRSGEHPGRGARTGACLRPSR